MATAASWFKILFSLLVLCGNILSVPISAKHSIFTEDTKQKITQLKDNGKQLLNRKHYQQAIKYYSAMLFLVEGVKGSRATEIRRRCGLTLAQCEMKTGRYSRAVARCSEVIEEACSDLEDLSGVDTDPSKFVKKNKSLLRSLALAHYRRAICLKYLQKLSLSMIDLRSALKYQPDDNCILEEIVDTHFKNVTIEGKEEVLLNELYDFVENCQVSFPRDQVTMALVNKLCSSKAVDADSNPISSDPMSLISNFGSPGMGIELSDLKNMGGLLEMVSGVDGQTVNKVIEIITAVNSVVSQVRKLVKFLTENKIPILVGGSTLWISFTLFRFFFTSYS